MSLVEAFVKRSGGTVSEAKPTEVEKNVTAIGSIVAGFVKAQGGNVLKYSDDQPRDDKGQFAGGASSSKSESTPRFEAKFSNGGKESYLVVDHQTHQQYPVSNGQKAEQHAESLNSLHNSGKSDEASAKHASNAKSGWKEYHKS